MNGKIDFDKGDGIVPVIVQDADTSVVLMLGYMNEEALEKTLNGGVVVFWSRTKQRLWKKGETSGNILRFVSLHPDCDRDTLLIKARPEGPTCHTGSYSCFEVEKDELFLLKELDSLINDRKNEKPENSYTVELLSSGTGYIGQKLGEEAIETVIAAIQEEPERLHEESADLFYHLLVLLHSRGSNLSDVVRELKKRRGSPGQKM